MTMGSLDTGDTEDTVPDGTGQDHEEPQGGEKGQGTDY